MSTVRVRLLASHTHAGERLPPGQVLALEATQAAWLIALRVAERLPEAAPASPRKKTFTTRKD